MEVSIIITGDIEEVLDICAFIRTRSSKVAVADVTGHKPKEPTAKEEPVPEPQIKEVEEEKWQVCPVCKQPFTSVKEGTKYCSKKCNQKAYMKDWYLKKKGTIPADSLKEKLKKISETCPAPTKRPNITRELV